MTTELPEGKFWETDAWRVQTTPSVHQDPGERNNVTKETEPDLPVSVQESQAGVLVHSDLLQGGGTEYNSAAQVFLKEVLIIFIIPTLVWPQAKQQGGSTAPPINRKLH